MSWWLSIVAIYLVVCWTAWFFILRNSLASAASEPDGESCGSALVQNSSVYWLTLIFSTLVVGPFLPLLAAHCTWVAIREWRAWSKFARTHREALMEPLHPANVPHAGQVHFEACAPPLVALGFQQAGTFLYKPEPFAMYLQCWLSSAGETVADVALIDDALSVSFVSVLDDGHVLETSCSADPLPPEEIEAINESGRFTTQMFPAGFGADDLARTYRRHLDLLGALEQRLGRGTLHVPLDQVPALKRHENAVFGHVLFSQGKVDNQPSSPPVPVGDARRIVPAGGAPAARIALAAPGAAGSATSASAYSSPAMPY